jgi:hypothetical protein
MIQRLEGWEKRFSAFLQERQRAPFVWGENDCILFAADAIVAITGFDLAASVRGLYASEEEAKALLKQRGGLEAAITEAFGFKPHDNRLKAHRGDGVLVEAHGFICAAVMDDSICSENRLAVPMPKSGFTRLPMTAARKIWSF